MARAENSELLRAKDLEATDRRAQLQKLARRNKLLEQAAEVQIAATAASEVEMARLAAASEAAVQGRDAERTRVTALEARLAMAAAELADARRLLELQATEATPLSAASPLAASPPAGSADTAAMPALRLSPAARTSGEMGGRTVAELEKEQQAQREQVPPARARTRARVETHRLP